MNCSSAVEDAGIAKNSLVYDSLKPDSVREYIEIFSDGAISYEAGTPSRDVIGQYSLEDFKDYGAEGVIWTVKDAVEDIGGRKQILLNFTVGGGQRMLSLMDRERSPLHPVYRRPPIKGKRNYDWLKGGGCGGVRDHPQGDL